MRSNQVSTGYSAGFQDYVFLLLITDLSIKPPDESSFQRYPIHIAPDGRSALSALLSPSELDDLRKRSSHGITHGGIVLHTPQFSSLFSIRRYEGETPQFVHRWVLKEVLEQGVDLCRDKRVVRVREVDDGGKIEVVFDDATHELADLVIGEWTFFRLI
jgi:hypothetical protein